MQQVTILELRFELKPQLTIFLEALRSGLLPSLVLLYVLLIYLVVFFVSDYVFLHKP